MVNKKFKRRKRRISFLMSLMFLASLFFYTPMTNLSIVKATITDPDIIPSASLSADQINKGDTVRVNYTITPTGNLTSQTKPVDIVLLIDDSWSMVYDGKLEYSKDAAKRFIRNFSSGLYGNANRVGVVAFDTFSYKVNRLTNINSSNNVKSLCDQIDNIEAEGSTNLHQGLITARSLFNINDNSRDKYIIILTDGCPTNYVVQGGWTGNFDTVGNRPYPFMWSKPDYYWNYEDWMYPYDSNNYGNGTYNATARSNALIRVGSLRDEGINTYAIGVATSDTDVDKDFISQIAAKGNGKWAYTTDPGDITSYYQYFLNNITQTGLMRQIRITQTIPSGLEVDTSSLPSGWSYNSTTRVLSGTLDDILFNSNSQTPSQVTIPVTLRATKEGIYDNCQATLSYLGINGSPQSENFCWGKLKVIIPVNNTADIAASGSVINRNASKYSKVYLNYTISPNGSVVANKGTNASCTIKNIKFTQRIPNGLTVDTATMPRNWNYNANTGQLSGSFDDVEFNNGESAPSAVTKTVALNTLNEGLISIPNANLTYTKELNVNGRPSDDPKTAVISFEDISVSAGKLNVLYVHGRNKAAEIHSNNDMDVTEMTIESFISHTMMDVNGNYDLIYFGSGNYISAKNPANTTENLNDNQKISPYDITNRMAEKVRGFIESNQLVIFNNNVFNDSNSNFKANFNNLTQTVAVRDPITKITVSRQKIYFVSSETENDLIQKYVDLGLHKPSLNVTAAPQNYSVNPSGTENKNLSFTFTPRSTDNRSLTVNLYLDKNGDGKFGYVDNTGRDLELVATQSAVNGIEQTLNYQITTKTLTQLLYWKLEIVDDRGQKAEKVDCLLFKDQPITMNVLQIMPNNGTGSASNAGSYANLKSLFENISVNGHKLGEIPGIMKINVTPMVADDFDNPTVYNDLNGKYDMIVVGFDDCYNKDITFSQGATDAINNFITTGQGVMFSHDTIWGSGNSEIKNAFIRVVGQKDQSTRYCHNGGLDSVNSLAAKEVGGYSNSNNYLTDIVREKVKKVNDSSITNFPYPLPPVLNIAATHVQYYRLNLENVDPWYNMYDDYATGKHIIDNDDSVNSYYTYSIGNVTFSGTGHTTQTFQNKTDELELFANTIIRAYTGANHAPDLNVAEPTDNEKVSLSQDRIPVAFKASDFDIYDQATNALTAKIYVDIDNSGNYIQANQVYMDTNGDGTPDTLGSGNIQFTSDQDVKVAVPKNFADARDFKIKVEVQDTKGAKSYEEIPMKSCDQPVLQAASSVDKTGCLVGDLVTFTTSFSALGSETNGKIDNIKVSANINSSSVSINGGSSFEVTPNGTGKKVTMKSGVLDQINYNPSPNPASKTVSYSVAFASAGSYSISNSLSYKADGTVKYPTIPGLTVDVRNGKITANFKDNNNTNVSGIKVIVTKNNIEVGSAISGNNGEAVVLGLSSGTYNISVDSTTLPARYLAPVAQSVQLSYGSSSQICNFVLQDAIPNVTNCSISALTGGSETNKLSAKKNQDAQIVVRFHVDKQIDRAVINLNETEDIDFSIQGATCTRASASCSGKSITLSSTSPSGNLAAGNYTVVITIKGNNKATSAAYGNGTITLNNIICNKNGSNYTTTCNSSIDVVIYNGIKLG